MKRSVIASLVFTLLVAGPVLAGKTTLIVQADGAQFGDTVLVTAEGNSDSQIWVLVDCYANDTTVPSPAGTHILGTFAYVGSSPGVHGSPYVTLSNDPYWTAGGADCVAQMWDSRHWRPMPNVTDEFSVLP